MPVKANKECAFSGCHQTTNIKHCPVHKLVERGIARARKNPYRDRRSRWENQRKRIIARDRGICQLCHEPVRKTEQHHIDHIVALEDGGTWSDHNLQLTHKRCHSRKTLQERRKRGEKI